MAELRARLIQRWLSQNLGPAAAIRRAETNDLANAQSVIDLALPCDLTLTIHPEV
jgi:fructokinase